MAIETKVGVYICSGCEIGDALDVEALQKVATDELKVAVCKVHEKLCNPEGLKMIQDDISAEGLNRVVIAACSGRTKVQEFNFKNGVMTDRVPIREQVAWVMEPNDEDTQMAAVDYLTMGVVRMRNTEYPEPLIEEINKTVLVVGGGMSGMRSALSSANMGYETVLVEKEDKLGGWAAKYTKVFPKTPPYAELADPEVNLLIQKVESHPKIKVYKGSTVKRISGEPGKFEVELEGASKGEKFSIGSIVLASGWKPYDPENLGHLGYGRSPNVVTNVQVEEMMSNGGIKRPSDGSAPKSVAFIQCAGSRDQDHLPYCSAVCCRVSLKQAMYVRQAYPDAQVFILYKDLRSPGQYEQFYKNVQEDEGVFLTKGEVVRVDAIDGDKVEVELEDTLFGENVVVQADLLVLATGMVPTTKVEDFMEEEAEEEKEEEAETETAEGDEEADTGVSAEVGAKILNLTYRKGTDLPTLKYGFPDSHFICFPYETLRTGIYAAGTVRAPMDLATADNDAYGAALKAIQALEMIGRGETVHPRAGDTSNPDFFLQRCTQCKRCTEECPFGTLDEDEKGTPQTHPNRCRRCGICMGACPERIVSFKNYSVHIIGEMLKSLEIPEEEDEKPRVLAFMCENDAIPSLDIAARHRLKINPYVRIIPVRCLGSMNVVWIADALSAGYDGVLLIGCKHGDDYQCHFIKGSELANTRMENVQEKLKQLVLEEERVQIVELALNEWEKIPKVFEDFMEDIDTVGPNPYKGF